MKRELFDQQKYPKAEQLLRHLVQQRKKVLKTKYFDTLWSKYQLAVTFYKQWKYPEEEQLLRQLVQQLEKVLGAEHVNTLWSKYQLVVTLYEQQKYPEAEQLFRQSVQQREKVLGAEHIDTLRSKYQLALTLREQQKYPEAEQLLRQLELQRLKKALGAEIAVKLESNYNLPDSGRRYFIHRRTLPELPGYEWQTQIRKYSPHQFSRGLNKKGCNGVFCHRGLYDRAMNIPENSKFSIENGISQGLLLHEVDVRMSTENGELFLAHDEVASCVTSKARNWASLNVPETNLVTKHFDVELHDLASSYLNTNEKVPNVEDLLNDDIVRGSDDRCLQLDLRGKGFPRAIRYFSMQPFHSHKVLLKGYNFDFSSGQDLEAALTAENSGEQWTWNGYPLEPRIMMVFYSKPFIDLALQAKGIDPEYATLEERSNLDFQDIYNVIMKQVVSFIEMRGLDKVETLGHDFIPEIAHSGLGLGYDKNTKQAVNPLDGTPITDQEVILESRIDRAMIDVCLELKEKYPKLYFASCTRLYDVRTPEGKELVANIRTGQLKAKPDGEKGISAKLRSIHGGLFPQSDIFVADKPFAEIAARTWIDEYANLDRRQLLKLSYADWLAQRPNVAEAVNKLNGPFLPNTYSEPQHKWYNWRKGSVLNLIGEVEDSIPPSVDTIRQEV